MTCNQLILLLRIYRGDVDTNDVGTHRQDAEHLLKRRLIEAAPADAPEGMAWTCTQHGDARVRAVLELI